MIYQTGLLIPALTSESALNYFNCKTKTLFMNNMVHRAALTTIAFLLSLASFSQAGTTTPGSISIDTVRTTGCANLNLVVVKYKLPAFTPISGTGTTTGSMVITLTYYQNSVRLTSTALDISNYANADSILRFAFTPQNTTTIAGYDYVITAAFYLNSSIISTQMIGTIGEGVKPGLDNDHFFSCNKVYYSKPSGDLHNVKTWGRNANGTGDNPAGFENTSTYTLANRGSKYTMTGDWDIGGGFLQIPVSSVLELNGFTYTAAYMGRGERGTISGTPLSNLIYRAPDNRETHELNMTRGAGDLNNLTVEGCTLIIYPDKPVNIYGVLDVSKGYINSQAAECVTLKSSAERTARVAPISDTTFGYANHMTIERYIPARRAWRLLSAPVFSTSLQYTVFNTWQEGATTSSLNPNPFPGYGTHITEGPANLGFDHNPLNSMTSIKKYNTATQTWDALLNTNSERMGDNALFLFVRGDRGISPGASSAPATSTVLRTQGRLRYGNQTYAVEKKGFTAIPNPFVSPINFATISRTNVQNNFYVWDPKMGGENGVGAYVLLSFNGTSYDVIPSSVSAESQYIQSGQAFLVHSDGNAPGSITIKESDKAGTPAADVFRNSSSSNTAGSPFDVKISTTTPGIRISLQSVEKDKQISLLDEIFSSYDKKFSDRLDEFDAEKMENVGENIAIVRDGHILMAERSRELNSTDIIQLRSWNLQPNKQYQLEIHPVDPGAGIRLAYLHDNYLKSVTALDLNKLSHVQFYINDDAASSAGNRFSLSFTASEALAIKSEISAFPNPVIGKTIQLAFSNQPQGKYNLQLINSAGQLVYSTTMNHAVASSNERLLLDKRPVAGVYLLKVSNGKMIKSLPVVFE